jgi:hypothetical protein
MMLLLQLLAMVLLITMMMMMMMTMIFWLQQVAPWMSMTLTLLMMTAVLEVAAVVMSMTLAAAGATLEMLQEVAQGMEWEEPAMVPLMLMMVAVVLAVTMKAEVSEGSARRLRDQKQPRDAKIRMFVLNHAPPSLSVSPPPLYPPAAAAAAAAGKLPAPLTDERPSPPALHHVTTPQQLQILC